MTANRPPADDDTLLLEFLRGRDAPCPLCGYNLRDLSASTCPECREPLALAVGFRKPRFGWFLATIAPGLFSGISAALMLVPLVGSVYFSANPPAPWWAWATDAFGWLSALAALALVKFRHGFLRQPQSRQRAWAVTAWVVHLGAFAVLMVILARQ